MDQVLRGVSFMESNKRMTMQQLLDFSHIWREAGERVILDWDKWEHRAATVFGFDNALSMAFGGSGEMHALMEVITVLCWGKVNDIKPALRKTSPTTLDRCFQLCGHLPQCTPVITAERHYRSGSLARDWTLDSEEPGRVTVRSEFRSEKKGIEH